MTAILFQRYRTTAPRFGIVASFHVYAERGVFTFQQIVLRDFSICHVQKLHMVPKVCEQALVGPSHENLQS